MKKKDVVELVRHHVERDEYSFTNKVFEIARDFDANGDPEIASYLMSLVSDVGSFVTQAYEPSLTYLRKSAASDNPLPLPNDIATDITGIVNAANRNIGVNKFLFQGPPGTGKTESAKHMARLLNRTLYIADFSAVIDSKLGQTSKNIVGLFEEMGRFPDPSNIMVLFDEIDALVLDRTDSSDLREMGRATSTFLRELDDMGPGIVLVATTNLFDRLDKAIVRRFDFIVDFDRYNVEALQEVASTLLDTYLTRFKTGNRDARLFKKILALADPLPYPGDLVNIIRTSIAFSNPDDPYDYLRRLYRALAKEPANEFATLRAQSFTIREIELLTQVPRSTVSRELKATADEQ